MLEAAGLPSPSTPSQAGQRSRRRGWPVEHWSKTPGAAPPDPGHVDDAARLPHRRRRAVAVEGTRLRAQPRAIRRLPRGLALAGTGHGVAVGPLGSSTSTRRACQAPGWLPVRSRVLPDLRLRPGDASTAGLALLRADRQLSVRARPRDRRRREGRCAGRSPRRARTRTGLRGARHRHRCARHARRPQRRLRAGRLRASRAGTADRLLRRHGWRLVAGLVAHESQLHEVPRGLSDEAAVWSSRPPAPCTPPARRRRRAGRQRRRVGRRHPRPAHDRRAAPLPPARHRSSPPPNTPSSATYATRARGRPMSSNRQN